MLIFFFPEANFHVAQEPSLASAGGGGFPTRDKHSLSTSSVRSAEL